jgi:putative hydrolase of the HAD superfamily
MDGTPAKALILDFGGVITKTLFETHRQTEAALGLAPGTLTWRGPFEPETDSLWCEMQAGRISERDYWTTRTREVGHLLGEKWEAMETLVNKARATDPVAVVRPEARRAVGAVHAAGIRLAILSNELDLFYGAEFRALLPMLELFETIVDATHTGILKPDPRAYQAVVNALDLPPSSCVFVDDQKRNVDGALAMGLRAVAFDVRRPERSYAEALEHLGLTLPSD